jgi:hypothetical protein
MNNSEAMTTNRFHTFSTGPDEAALRAAFHHCGAVLQARGCSTMALAVHTKNNLDGVIRNVFGDTVIRVLDQESRLDLNGITIQLLTEKIQLRTLQGPVLAAFVNPEKLSKIIACRGVTDIVFVPWAAEEHAAYVAAYPSSQEIFRSARFAQLETEGG